MDNLRDGNFSAAIPGPVSAGQCDYYIAAADASGRTAGMPRTQPAAFYSFFPSAQYFSGRTAGNGRSRGCCIPITPTRSTP